MMAGILLGAALVLGVLYVVDEVREHRARRARFLALCPVEAFRELTGAGPEHDPKTCPLCRPTYDEGPG